MNTLQRIPFLAVIWGIALSWMVAESASGETATAPTTATAPADVVETARAAAKAGKLCYRLTSPAEVKALLGTPSRERKDREGEGDVLILEYPGLELVLGRWKTAPYSLLQVEAGHKQIDIGKDKPIRLRTPADLGMLDSFFGLSNVSLVDLDLRDQLNTLNELPFDSRTRWPSAEKLPAGFDPADLLEKGKNPGLGVRGLHSQGIDGRGVHIAIIDQPLVRKHREYKDRIVEYTPIDVAGVPPQMHGPAVASIAVGKTCGTAPGASLHFYAVPTWKWSGEHCRPYAETLEKIVEQNRSRPAAERVRAVSISLGMFSAWPDYGLWKDAVKRAEAAGVLVITCDQASYRLGVLGRKTGADFDLPENYVAQRGMGRGSTLLVPGGDRTTAYHTGTEDYFYWREGGMSWTVPYLAGLAALACQVNPQIEPQQIASLWSSTAAKTQAGTVVNPPAFIEAVRRPATKDGG